MDDLLAACERAGFAITREELDTAVAEPTKRRYAYDATGERVRAVQGHSVDVDLGYEPAVPPERLYHGTHPGALDAILIGGLRPMGRRHVHLSPDAETARRVGARRGRPVVLTVRAGDLHRAGHAFFRAENGVWLTDAVPADHLALPS